VNADTPDASTTGTARHIAIEVVSAAKGARRRRRRREN
jgi:hypothetical protein